MIKKGGTKTKRCTDFWLKRGTRTMPRLVTSKYAMAATDKLFFLNCCLQMVANS